MPNSDSLPPQDAGQPTTAAIDVLKFDARSGVVHLVILERRPWDLSSDQPFLLQEKLNAYLSFVLDGEMLEAYPQFRNRAVSITVECSQPPPEELIPFLKVVREQCELQGIDFTVDVKGDKCGCGQPVGDCGTQR